MFLKILAHPVFVSLNFHMPMILDLSHPLIMLQGENGSGKSTLLHSIHYALSGEQVDNYSYRLVDKENQTIRHESKVFLFDAEQHNPRNQLHLFEEQPEMKEFMETASHGQVMLSMYRQTFPSLPPETVLLLDEPEMALSQSNQCRVVQWLRELVEKKSMKVVAATHSVPLLEAPETYVINLDEYINRNIDPTEMPPPERGLVN